jgi:hypothetical protein
MTIKATHNGTCQVCGREQALPGGIMAKHGYDVRFHYFRGVCPGAQHQPLEQDRAKADRVAEGLLVTSRNHAKDALAVAAGELLPRQAWSGQWARVNGRPERIMWPFADAEARYQQAAVAALQHFHESEAREHARISKGITDRANKITGIKPLTPRVAEAPRKVIGPGTQFKLFGELRTALRVEDRMARGCGPHLNGNVVLHVVYATDSGKEFAYPVQRIRQAAIVG